MCPGHLRQIKLGVAGLVKGDGECCLACEAPAVRYYSVDEPHGHCGESCMDPHNFGIFKIFESNLTIADGSTGFTSCADLGWPSYRETVSHGVWPIRITVDLYDRTEHTRVAVADSCSLYEIQGDTCGQSDLDCLYKGQAKLFRRTLNDGTCAEHGFTVKTGENTISVPFLGDITATSYSKGAALQSTGTCSLYEIQGDTCGQSDLDCAYTGPAKTFRRSLIDGTCAEHGFTVQTGEDTISVPFLGDITAKTYSKGAVLESGEACSLYEIKDDTCGQSDLDCSFTGPAKTFRRSLIDGTCAEHGFTVKTGEQTISVPFLGDITATTYSKGAVLKSGEACSLYEIKDDTCGQSDLDCSFTGPAKTFRRSLIDGTCAEHGFTVKTGEQTISVPFLGDITATTYSKGAVLESGESCSLYEIQDDTCGQSDLDCAYTSPAKTFRRTLNDGTCAEHGFTVKTGETTMTVPFIGDIVATTYSKSSMLV